MQDKSQIANRKSQIQKPSWLRAKLPYGSVYTDVKKVLDEHNLHTVCSEASCPNVGECWGQGTATFLILGDICTRSCLFCDVKGGGTLDPDGNEPQMLRKAVEKLNLSYVVITSVTRDDLDDGGARHYANVLYELHSMSEPPIIELLISDLQGDHGALDIILDESPDVLGHNIETVPRLYKEARTQADYQRSLNIIEYTKQKYPKILTKSALLLGLGEEHDEILETINDLHNASCDILYMGQYLQPSKTSLPVKRYYTPEEFEELREEALAIGFKAVKSAPLVRSSYKARDTYEKLISSRPALCALRSATEQNEV